MAAEDQPAINLHLFQIQAEAGALEVVQGIAVRELSAGELYVDPQNDYGHPTDSTDGDNLILGVAEALAADITPDRRIIHASLPLDAVYADRYHLREEIGLDELGRPVENPIGQVALLGLAEHPGFAQTRLFTDDMRRSRELHAATMEAEEESDRYQAKLLLLAEGGDVHIDVRDSRSPKRYSLHYLANTSFLVFEELGGGDEGSEGGFSGGSGPRPDDRQPRPPVNPVGSAAAALELPPAIEERPLQAIGMSC